MMSTLVLWIVAILGIFSIDYLSPLLDVSPKNLFLGIAVFAGLGLGSTQSSSRTVVGLLVPPEKSAELWRSKPIRLDSSSAWELVQPCCLALLSNSSSAARAPVAQCSRKGPEWSLIA